MKQGRAEKMDLQGLFFDFDGVLIDSTAVKIEGFRELFEHVSDSELANILEYHRMHGGISRVEKIKYAYREVLQQPLDTKDLQRLAQKYSDLVMEKVVGCSPVNGALELLEQFYNRCEIFLISGTPEEELREIVSRRKMTKYFREILGSPVRKPIHVNELLAKYSLNPQGCVFIGDALTDFDAARQTRLNFIGIQRDVSFPTGTITVLDCTGVADVLARNYRWTK